MIMIKKTGKPGHFMPVSMFFPPMTVHLDRRNPTAWVIIMQHGGRYLNNNGLDLKRRPLETNL
jgi:hypothetical protein